MKKSSKLVKFVGFNKKLNTIRDDEEDEKLLVEAWKLGNRLDRRGG